MARLRQSPTECAGILLTTRLARRLSEWCLSE
jgi:hypothetical protein